MRASMTIEGARAHLKCLPSGLFTVLGLSFVKFQELLVEAEKVYVRKEAQLLRTEVCAAARALGTFGDDLLPLLEEDFRRFAPAARVFRGASRCAEELCRGLGDEEAVRSAVQELLFHVQGCYCEVCPLATPSQQRGMTGSHQVVHFESSHPPSTDYPLISPLRSSRSDLLTWLAVWNSFRTRTNLLHPCFSGRWQRRCASLCSKGDPRVSGLAAGFPEATVRVVALTFSA